MISGNTEIGWPACSPYEALCDNFLWGICDQEIRKVKPRDLGEQLEETLHGALLLTAHIVKTQKLIQVYLSSTT